MANNNVAKSIDLKLGSTNLNSKRLGANAQDIDVYFTDSDKDTIITDPESTSAYSDNLSIIAQKALNKMDKDGTNAEAVVTFPHNFIIGGSNSLISDPHLNVLEGQGNISETDYTHIEGESNHAQKDEFSDNNFYLHIEGITNIISGKCNHIEGESNLIINSNSQYNHIEGHNNDTPWIEDTHIEGHDNNIHILSSNSHIEGYNNDISQINDSHIEGNNHLFQNNVTGVHVEGNHNTVNASNCHTEGDNNNIQEHAYFSHVEGEYNEVDGEVAHVEGRYNVVSQDGSEAHVEGEYNTANGRLSHIEGSNNTAFGDYSHVGGRHVEAYQPCSFVQGSPGISSSQWPELPYNTGKPDACFGISPNMESFINPEDGSYSHTVIHAEHGHSGFIGDKQSDGQTPHTVYLQLESLSSYLLVVYSYNYNEGGDKVYGNTLKLITTTTESGQPAMITSLGQSQNAPATIAAYNGYTISIKNAANKAVFYHLIQLI